jgi:hypothetical protein
MRHLAVLLVFASFLLGGCDAYKEGLLSQNGAGCANGSLRPPGTPPKGSNADSGADIEEVVFALRDVQFDQSDDRWKSIGYNIDNRCTDDTNGLTECERLVGTASPDGMMGIDNVFGSQLYALVNLQYVGRPGVANDTLDLYGKDTQASGESVILVRIRNWNGTPNDSRVTVDISTSVFGLPGDASGPPDPAPCADGAGGDCLPAWAGTGNDWFWARGDNFLVNDPTEPKIVDDNAYITDDTFVMRIPDRSEIRFTGSTLGLSVFLTEGIATAHISEDRMTLGATVSGRWAKNDLIETAEHVGVCAGTPTYKFLLMALNAMLDVRSDPSTAGATVPCDAISMGITFNGFRARFAGLTPGAVVPNGCADSDGGVGP